MQNAYCKDFKDFTTPFIFPQLTLITGVIAYRMCSLLQANSYDLNTLVNIYTTIFSRRHTSILENWADVFKHTIQRPKIRTNFLHVRTGMNKLTVNVQGTGYPGLKMSISWSLILHPQVISSRLIDYEKWAGPCVTPGRYFNCLCHVSVEEWYKS